MSKVIVFMTMSFDGFIAGANIRPEEPMGDGGEELHDWMFNKGNTDDNPEEFQAEYFDNVGAYIIGGRTFELGYEPWGENPPYHAPCFILWKEPRETITMQGGTSYNFVSDGIESALEQAKKVAGDKKIIIMGGANAAQQYLNAGLVDELNVHVAHMLLGQGTRLFDNLTLHSVKLEEIAVVNRPGVTHFKFRVPK